MQVASVHYSSLCTCMHTIEYACVANRTLSLRSLNAETMSSSKLSRSSHWICGDTAEVIHVKTRMMPVRHGNDDHVSILASIWGLTSICMRQHHLNRKQDLDIHLGIFRVFHYDTKCWARSVWHHRQVTTEL